MTLGRRETERLRAIMLLFWTSFFYSVNICLLYTMSCKLWLRFTGLENCYSWSPFARGHVVWTRN